MDKSLVFTPGCKWVVESGVLFIEYESMTGEYVRARFDLSPGTHYITDGYKLETIRNICEHSDDFFIQKVEYYEQENHMLIGGKMLVPTKVYFEAKAKKTAEEIHNKLLRNVANSAYGITSRDWGDVLADSARYIYMSGARRSGKTMWLSNIEKSIEEDARNDAIERWLNESPIKPLPLSPVAGKLYFQDKTTGEMKEFEGVKELKINGYFDTDMAMTKEEMQYCRNDVAVTEKLFKEEQIMRFNSCKPTVKNVIFNAPATIVMWSDGTKTVVKCGENDIFDPEKGVAMCCMKKLLGTNKTGSNYLDKVDKYFDKYDEDYIEECKTIGEILRDLWSTKKSTDIPPEESIEKEFEAVTSDDWTVVPADENTTAEENGE